MRASREQAAASRERILEESSRLFRERGFDEVSVADLMRRAGMTHGGFYGHFASKQDLIVESVTRTLRKSVAKWQRIAGRSPEDPVAAIARSYLSTEHRDRLETGCLVPALASEIGRQDEAVRHSLTDGVRALVDQLVELTPDGTDAAKRTEALALFASLVGAVTLARAVDDPAFSDEILRAVEAVVAPE
jgi:TetR/AcrR family transcriptional regulator, transcriptional repressor for nem operon